MSNGFSLNLTMTDYHDPQANHILDAEIYQNTLIISAMIQGIEFYNISDGGQLEHIDHFTLGQNGKANCVEAIDNYAYFTSRNGLYVVDISDPDFIYKTEQVSLILKDLGISDIPCIRVNNKSDKVDMDINSESASSNENEVWFSALKSQGMGDLVNSIQLNRKKFMVKEWVELQPSQGRIRAKLYSLGKVLEETTSDTGLIQLQLEIDETELNNLVSNKGIDLRTNKTKEAI